MQWITDACLGDQTAWTKLKELPILITGEQGTLLIIESDDSGNQKGYIATYQPNGSGMTSTFAIPTAFYVNQIAYEQDSFMLYSESNEVLQATPEQFLMQRIIVDQDSVRYQHNLTDDFFKIPFKQKGLEDTYHDATLGELQFNVSLQYYTSVLTTSFQQQPIEVIIHVQQRQELMDVLPVVHPILEQLQDYYQQGLEELWQSGTEEDQASMKKQDFFNLFILETIAIAYYGNFDLWLIDTEGILELDGYSPVFYFDTDRTLIRCGFE